MLDIKDSINFKFVSFLECCIQEYIDIGYKIVFCISIPQGGRTYNVYCSDGTHVDTKIDLVYSFDVSVLKTTVDAWEVVNTILNRCKQIFEISNDKIIHCSNGDIACKIELQ